MPLLAASTLALRIGGSCASRRQPMMLRRETTRAGVEHGLGPRSPLPAAPTMQLEAVKRLRPVGRRRA